MILPRCLLFRNFKLQVHFVIFTEISMGFFKTFFPLTPNGLLYFISVPSSGSKRTVMSELHVDIFAAMLLARSDALVKGYK